MDNGMNTKTEIGTEIEPEAPKLNKLLVKIIEGEVVQLYQIDLEPSDEGKGRRIKNYVNRTIDYEHWTEPHNLCWKVPVGDYLVAQGPDLWLVNVRETKIKWRNMKGIMQNVTARWNKLVVTDKAPVLMPNTEETGILQDAIQKSKSDSLGKKRSSRKRT
jgi:hypothetical protein